MTDSVELVPMPEYETVQNWLGGLREHWGGDPANTNPEQALAAITQTENDLANVQINAIRELIADAEAGERRSTADLPPATRRRSRSAGFAGSRAPRSADPRRSRSR